MPYLAGDRRRCIGAVDDEPVDVGRVIGRRPRTGVERHPLNVAHAHVVYLEVARDVERARRCPAVLRGARHDVGE